MDRMNWPWKKKSSDKIAAEKAVDLSLSAVGPLASAASQYDQDKMDNHKKPQYIKISVESHTQLTGLLDQVTLYQGQIKRLEGEVKELNDKLSTAQSEITSQENMVKQHAKVAEDAISGWEKAEAESSTLKNDLESVTLLKLTAEDWSSHLDGALKECMRQIRNLTEEHEQKLQEVIQYKTEQYEKLEHELDEKIAEYDQELRRSAAENDALSRSLQERSNMLINISEQKSKAEAEIELLKSNIESREKEINSLKYELHIVTKELEIRNEEKNMCVRSAEIANKQHLEGVKKIAKLEAECQRLRVLVRKKLPGPAALAQMKVEVENMGREFGEMRYRRPLRRPSSPHLSPLPEISQDIMQKCLKENELLRERLFAMEEETKMLKEVLTTRDSELITSRNICTSTVSNHQNLEILTQVPDDNIALSFSSPNAHHSSSLTSMSVDRKDDEECTPGSQSRASVFEASEFKMEKKIECLNNTENVSHRNIMDDFLEMEKLANLSNESEGANPTSRISINSGLVIVNDNTSAKAMREVNSISMDHLEADLLQNGVPTETEAGIDFQLDAGLLPFIKLQSRISMAFGSMSKDTDMKKVLENIRKILQDTQDALPQQISSGGAKANPSAFQDCNKCLVGGEVSVEKEICLSQGSKTSTELMDTISREIVNAISQINDFVLLLGNEIKAVQSSCNMGDEISQKFDEFSTTFNEVICNKRGLADFVQCLAHLLARASKLRLSVLGYKNSDSENSSSDCIDKVALPENKGNHNSSGGQYPSRCTHLSDFNSSMGISQVGSFDPISELTDTSLKFSGEEFHKMKRERDNIAMDMSRCTEDLESTKSQLQEMEQLLAEVKSQLTSSQKSNGLAETQLKCMAESYKMLETHVEELQAEVNRLQAKIESMDNELLQEKKRHQDALARCEDLQEQLNRTESVSAAENDASINQERELSVAAEKLAECQESIFLLGKQLKALRPQTETALSPRSGWSLKGNGLTEEAQTATIMSWLTAEPTATDNANSTKRQSTDTESPVDLHDAPFSPSDSESNTFSRSAMSSKQHRPHQQQPTKSVSFSQSPCQTPEKHSRGFSRFFSSK